MNHPTRRRFGLQLLVAGTTAAAGAPAFADAGDCTDDRDSRDGGRVYTSTNAPGGNELLLFAPARHGGLVMTQRIATQGLGSGAGLGSQGAVTLSGDGRHLFVVNAGSHSVSTFALAGGRAALRGVTASGGLMPTSVAECDGLVYVLNAQGNGNVAGFRNLQGRLQPLDDGLRGLSAAGGTAPGQVGFGSDGELLVVSERNSNRLSSWPVRSDGSLGAITVTPSSGLTPFGFAFDRRDHLIVTEAFGGAANASAVSSYRFDARAPATPRLVSASVPTTQTAACWLAILPNGRLAYAANAGSSSVSSYRIEHDGRIALAQAVAASTGANAGASDIAVSADGRRVVVLAGRAFQIAMFQPGVDGRLDPLGVGGGLPAGCAGIAAD